MATKLYNRDETRRKAAIGEASDFFWNVVLNYEGDDCLAWPFNRARGYGRVWHGGRMRTVSNLVCRYVHGEPPEGKLDAAHSCGKGHEGCVNPRHIRWASRAENLAEAVVHGTRGRGAFITHPRGRRTIRIEKNCKLSPSDVTRIRELKGQHSMRVVAERFGVSISQVNRIQKCLNWRDVA